MSNATTNQRFCSADQTFELLHMDRYNELRTLAS